MKVCILSMQRIINYGSFLQAWGVKKLCEAHGAKCEFIDIKPVKHKFKNNFYIVVRPLYLVARCMVDAKNNADSFKRKRNLLFLIKYHRKLGLTFFPNYRSDADILLIGSDEVFNICQKSMWENSLQLFGSGAGCTKVISYAASFGETSIDSLNQRRLSDSVRQQLMNFAGISVRDKNSEQIIETLCKKKPDVHLDPVLIYEFKDELKMDFTIRDYIIVYGYDDRLNEKWLIQSVKQLAAAKKKKIIAIGGYQSWCDENIAPDPFVVMKYFENADYVITDTFHGTLLSIKFNRKFATLTRTQNSNKLMDLLERFELTERIVNSSLDGEELQRRLEMEYDWNKVNTIVQEARQKSNMYLKKYLLAEK